MRPNWKRILTDAHVPFGKSGPDHITVQCPLCGGSDPSQHMAISTLGRGWRCFRNPARHSGRSYVYLLSRLIRCTEETARSILGLEERILPSEDTFSQTWREQLGVSTGPVVRPKTIKLPSEVKPVIATSRFAAPFTEYLQDRGYNRAEADWTIGNYHLHYARTGDYAWRLVIPIYDARGKLMTWTGRSIKPDAKIRYKTLPSQEAVKPPGDLLLGLPLLWEAPKTRCLVVCEGPFDAITVSALGWRSGVWGTCLFGVNVSEAQAELLEELSSRFERLRLLVDPDAALRVLGLRGRLPNRLKVSRLLPGLKDPGDLAKCEQGVEFVESLAA